MYIKGNKMPPPLNVGTTCELRSLGLSMMPKYLATIKYNWMMRMPIPNDIISLNNIYFKYLHSFVLNKAIRQNKSLTHKKAFHFQPNSCLAFSSLNVNDCSSFPNRYEFKGNPGIKSPTLAIIFPIQTGIFLIFFPCFFRVFTK